MKILSVVFTVHSIDFASLFISKIFDSLLSLKVELAPYSFIFLIIEGISMLPEEMHISKRCRNSPVAHYYSDLMEALRKQCPIIPVVLSTTTACVRISFYCTV